MVNYFFNNGSKVNVGKNINIDAKGMSDEQFSRLIDQVVNGDDKATDVPNDVQSSTETAEVTEMRTVKVTRPVASGDARNCNMDIVVTNLQLNDKVLGLLDTLMEGKMKKDAAAVIQAAILTGAILRPSYSQFCSRYGSGIISKSLYNRYVGADKSAFIEAELRPYISLFSEKLS